MTDHESGSQACACVHNSITSEACAALHKECVFIFLPLCTDFNLEPTQSFMQLELMAMIIYYIIKCIVDGSADETTISCVYDNWSVHKINVRIIH